MIILDHTLLVEGQNRESALQVISDLQKLFIRVKKFPDTTIIQLSQMNRNIENPERINNPSMHYPMRSDISSADTIFMHQITLYVFIGQSYSIYRVMDQIVYQ